MKQAAIFTFLAPPAVLTAKPSVDLSVEWRFALDPKDEIIDTSPETWSLADRIHLPGTVTSQGFMDSLRSLFRNP